MDGRDEVTAAGSTLALPRDSDWLKARLGAPMSRGDILLYSASHTFQTPGGGEIQLIRTARNLERIGLGVRPFVPWTDRLDDARLLHLFGMSREGLDLARIARVRRIPVILSPICWFEPRALMALAPSLPRKAIDLAKWAARRTLPLGLGWRAQLLRLCDLILPNSITESRQLSRLFGVDTARIHVVPNGVDARFADADPAAFRSAFGPDPFLLYVGRIEPRKNVLGLIRAARRTGLPLVVIGACVPGQEGYHDACRREGRQGVRWLPRVEHDDPMLASAYAAARVFALPSWFETPGLAALEAALAGTAVVITAFGCTREYFEENAIYVQPGRTSELAKALVTAWERGPSPGFQDAVKTRFLWSNVAQMTAEAYARVAP